MGGPCQPQRPDEYTSYLHKGEPCMIVEFRKWGNSLAVRIPKALADAIKASDGKRSRVD
jgi:hypothetical protein